jgi:predicted GNAT family N-acyltransferase
MRVLPAMQIRLSRHGFREYMHAVELREHVLRRPLGRSVLADELAAEAGQLQLTLYRDGELAACAMLEWRTPIVAKMRQVAVKPVLQRRILIEHFEAPARGQGGTEIMLHARQTAVPFYLRLGCQVSGEPLEEVGLPHLPMRKALAATICGTREAPR